MWNIYFELLNFVCEKNIVTKKFGIICCLLKNHLIELFEQGICKLLLYNISKATYQKAYLDTTFRFEQASAWNASFLVDLIIYIIGHSVRFIDLVSYTAYVVCVLILYISGGTYSLMSTPNDRFFWGNCHGNFIYFSEFLPAIC